MRVRIFTKDGMKEIERKYDYKAFDDNYRRDDYVAIDTIVAEVPNAPMPKIEFKKSLNSRLCHTPPIGFAAPDNLSYRR